MQCILSSGVASYITNLVVLFHSCDIDSIVLVMSKITDNIIVLECAVANTLCD